MKKMTPSEIVALLEKIALPYVKTALEQEHQTALANPKESQKLMKQILGGFLRSKDISPEEQRKLRDIIKNEKEILILPPDEEEINQTTEEVAGIIAISWAQFIILALRNKKKILLGEELLPQKVEEINNELWEALKNFFNSQPITFEQVKKIMRQFANEIILPCNTISVPDFGILIEIVSDEPRTFLARHTS